MSSQFIVASSFFPEKKRKYYRIAKSVNLDFNESTGEKSR